MPDYALDRSYQFTYLTKQKMESYWKHPNSQVAKDIKFILA